MLSSWRERSSREWAGPLVVAAIVGFGAWTRVSGFSGGTPWFDDAWVVLSSKVGVSKAIHMVNTTPLFSLGMRAWISLHPNALWWDQLPIFVLGLGTIVAVFALLRFFKMWWPLCYLGALVMAASPVAASYSTHVKQYNLDILFACLVLWLFERWRRDPDRRGAVLLAVAGVLGELVSATTLVVIVPVILLVLHASWVERARRRDAALITASIAVVAVGEYAYWLRRLSHGLDVGWTNRGYMMSFSSMHHVKFALQTMFTQLFYWMIAVPTGHPPDPSKLVTPMGVTIAIITAIILLAVTTPPVFGALRRVRTVAGPLVAPALAVGLSFVLALAAITPFGGGRTDEVIYPALLLVLAGALTWVSRLSWRPITTVLLVGVVLAAASCVLVGTRYRSQYPTIQLATLYHRLEGRVGPHEFVVVDPWLSFAWGVDQLTPTSVSFTHTYFDWSQGFHVVSNDNRVIISDQYFFPDSAFTGLNHYASRLWYVGETGGPTWPVAAPHDPLYVTRDYLALINAGWRPTDTTLRASHVIAILMTYSPSAPRVVLPPGAN